MIDPIALTSARNRVLAAERAVGHAADLEDLDMWNEALAELGAAERALAALEQPQDTTAAVCPSNNN